MVHKDQSYPFEHFINRELSLLQFQRRVLAQAADKNIPVLERLQFLCIVSSNLDEFFEVRVSSIREQQRLRPLAVTIDGLTAQQALEKISQDAHQLVHEQYQLLNQDILPALQEEGIVFLRRQDWTAEQLKWIEDYFHQKVFPILSPIGLDPAHPFPRILNKSLNFIVELEGTDAFGRQATTAILQAPRALPRIILLPPELCEHPNTFVFLSSVIHENINQLFSGMTALGCHQFRITRNSDLYVDEEEVKDLRDTLKAELLQRHFGDAVRLEVADSCPESMSDFLLKHFNLTQQDLYRVSGIVNLARLSHVHQHVNLPKLHYPPFIPTLPKELKKEESIFSAIQRSDILLHHPFQSFDTVISLLQQAADDPDVLAIKMTVYRTGDQSAIMEQLLRAAQKGKEVTAVLELMARFDEEANITWANKLEPFGVHIVYGVFGYKTHAKLLMIVRQEEQELRRYIHLGTGNYHPKTTRFYTDFGLLTYNQEIGEDVAEVFKQLTGLGQASDLKHLWQSPFSLHRNICNAIDREIEIARKGGKAHIIAKMNSLLESQIIERLYAASQAGVKIDLIVRGVCALRPGVEGMSENIRVRSIVGRFLEHHRIFYFLEEGAHKVYLSSADWMDRNVFRRIEVAFPILDPKIKSRVIREGLKVYLSDNCQAWEMQSDGRYRRLSPRSSGTVRNAQNMLLSLIAK